MASEAQDGIKTVECLRGRLLAEREASKTAKAEAYRMAKRLADLEKKLAEEMKRGEIAEKRLKLALKKLESLEVLDFSMSDSSASSVGTGSSWNNEASEGDGGSNSSISQEYAVGAVRQISENLDKLGCKDNLTEQHVEERLAIVPVSLPQEPVSCNPEAKNNVYDVLLALRNVREQLQNSIGRTVALYSIKELHGQQRTSTISTGAAPTK